MDTVVLPVAVVVVAHLLQRPRVHQLEAAAPAREPAHPDTDTTDIARVGRVLHVPAVAVISEYRELHGPQAGFEAWAEYLDSSLARIRKRLGGSRHHAIQQDLHHAVQQHRETGETAAHRAWIESLLVDYYDAMYNYQLQKKLDRVCFVGRQSAVQEFLASEFHISAL